MLAVLVLLVPARAAAFCGFYVGSADAKLFNDATVVVLMRDGTKTVLSMQNNYRGPAQDFALVVPVPVVLQREQVRTLPHALFERVEQLAAPRLVEYWERDPCAPTVDMKGMRPLSGSLGPVGGMGVTIETQFTVGEYDVVVLSADDSTGLDSWLRRNDFNIPEGAEPVLRPYVQKGMKFFVAKVDVSKVKQQDGRATLSPLRFHYDSAEFALPVRLGLLNSQGTQDLLVHILGDSRYEVANYDNVFIPTNLDVSKAARDNFGAFYVGLFDRVRRANPSAVVTEYAWSSDNCDPCPVPPLTASDLATLGTDVVWKSPSGPRLNRSNASDELGKLRPRLWQCYQRQRNADPSLQGTVVLRMAVGPTGRVTAVEAGSAGRLGPTLSCLKRVLRRATFAPPDGVAVVTLPLTFAPQVVAAKLRIAPSVMATGTRRSMVLTRLHARYTGSELTEDLVFRRAPPVAGGREVRGGTGLEQGAEPAASNSFQGRYAIRHRWKQPVLCGTPLYERWGPPPGMRPMKAVAARDLAFAARSTALTDFVAPDTLTDLFGSVPAPDNDTTAEPPPPAEPHPVPIEQPPAQPVPNGCGSCAVSTRSAPFGLPFLLLLLGRRRRST